MKTSQGQPVFSATLLKKPEVVEEGMRDIDRPPKLSPADYVLNNRDYVFILQRKLPSYIHRLGSFYLRHLAERPYQARFALQPDRRSP